MVYKVKSTIKYKGKIYAEGEIVKMSPEEAIEYGDKLIKVKMLTK